MVMPSSAMKRAMSARVNSSAGLPRARTSGFGLREMESVDSAAGEEVGNTADDAKVGSDGMETAPLNRAGEVAEPPRSRARRRRAGGGAAPILLGTPSPVPAPPKPWKGAATATGGIRAPPPALPWHIADSII